MTDATPDNVLFEWYERYVGDPTAETDVYLGFGLFFAGIALGAAGILVFLLSAAATDQGTMFALREVAVVATAGGFPVLLLGIVVLLPSDRRLAYVSVTGFVVCLGAVALFVSAYPMQWNVDGTPDYSAEGVAVYAVGLVAVVGATGAALVGHQVERAASGASGAGGSVATPDEASGTSDGAGGDAVTEDAVRRDIDEAMEGAEITWGGVERTETRRLELDTGDVGDIDGAGIEGATAETTRAAGDSVDDAVSGLRKLQGGDTETASSSGVDDQTAALSELRAEQRAEEQATEDGGVADRLRGLFDR